MALLASLCAVLAAACTEVAARQEGERPHPILTSDTRHPIPLSPPAAQEHRAVMLQHLESIQAVVNALVEEDYELAKGLTESHLGFFMHRQLSPPSQPQAREDAPFSGAAQPPDNVPPTYNDLARAHNEAAEELAAIIPTQDLKQIMPRFNNVLKACVACHLEYKVDKS